MTSRSLFTALLLGVAPALAAQDGSRPPLTLVPHDDSVLVYLNETPPMLGGFVVYRAPAGASARRVTAEPIRGVREPAFVGGMLGQDLPAVMHAVRATDEAELLRRLRGDRFAGTVLSLYYRGVAIALGRFYADTGLTRGAAYEYQVVFTDAAGRETDRRFSARVTVADVAPPPPTGLRVEPGDHEATVAWQFPRYRGDARDFVIGFHVYRADGAAGEWHRLTATPVLRNDAAPAEFRDDDLRNGVAYRYRVTAVDILDVESAPSAALAATGVDDTPPASPVDLSVRNGDGSVLLVWRMALEPDAVGYHVERSTGLSQPYTRLTTTPVPTESPQWLDTTVTGGRQYFYRVVALDAAGNASEPSNAISALPEDHTPPAPPAGVTVTLEGHDAVVRWNASSSRGVLGYHVYRGTAADRLARLTTQPVAVRAFVDSGYGGTGLIPGRRYVLGVSTVDSAFNESAPVTARLVLPDDQPPTPATAFHARSVMGRYAELDWVGSGALDVAGYVLTRTERGAPPVELARVPATTTAWRDTSAASGRTYVYALVATDSAGNRSSAVADTLPFGDFTPPASPRRLTARIAATGVELEWERVASPDLAGYVVYRSTLPTGTFERLTPDPVLALRFTDPSGRAEHYYEVRAVDRSGNESAASPVAGGRR